MLLVSREQRQNFVFEILALAKPASSLLLTQSKRRDKDGSWRPRRRKARAGLFSERKGKITLRDETEE